MLQGLLELKRFNEKEILHGKKMRYRSGELIKAKKAEDRLGTATAGSSEGK